MRSLRSFPAPVRAHVAATLIASIIAATMTPTAQLLAAPPKLSTAETEATQLKERGDTAMRELRYDDAIKAYNAAWEKAHLPAIRYNRGRAYEAMGKIAEAIDEFEGFLATASDDFKAKVPTLPDHVAEMKKKLGTLILDVDVAGARVIVGNAVVGTTPLPSALRLPVGATTLEITADGYAPFKKDLTLTGGASMTLSVRLEKLASAPTTMLTIAAEPVATVLVDGQSFGQSPIDATVSAGSHTVTLKRPGYSTRTSTVAIAAGEHKTLRLSLDAEGGILSQWWFWTSVGVVAAGAATLTIFAVSTRDPGRGDIAPGRISSPLVHF